MDGDNAEDFSVDTIEKSSLNSSNYLSPTTHAKKLLKAFNISSIPLHLQQHENKSTTISKANNNKNLTGSVVIEDSYS
jgi:hypothetical protein